LPVCTTGNFVFYPLINVRFYNRFKKWSSS
jgi:hypothetical protein